MRHTSSRKALLWLCCACIAGAGSITRGEEEVVLKAGMIGLDTSHVIAFSNLLNASPAKAGLEGVRVVAGFPGGSDIPASRDRVKGYTETLRASGIEIVDSIPTLLDKVDVVLLESVDGNPHLEQVLPVFRARKPVFIDKPLAGSLTDAIAIRILGDKYDVPWFSSSSLRFSPGILSLRKKSEELGEVMGCDAWSPCAMQPQHPDLFWYGVHGVEILYTILGPGCQQVTRVHTQGTDLVAGVWEGGKVGTYRGLRQGKKGYGAMVFGSKGIARSGDYTGYEPLIREVVRFFQTKEAPVDVAETLELFAFMEAADESKRRGGAPVSLSEVVKEAERKARDKVKAIDG